MREAKDSYTIVVFRGATSKPLRFSFSRTFVRRAMIVGASLLLVELLFIFQYVLRTGDMWELNSLRVEIVNAREQTTASANAVRDLKQRLLSTQEITEKQRGMLGIQPDKHEDSLKWRGGGD